MSTTTLETLCAINSETLNGATPPDFAFRYVDISAVTGGRIDWSQVREMLAAKAPSRAKRRLRSGDVLLCTVRPGLKNHTRIVEREETPLVGSTGFAVLRAYEPSDSSYVFHQLFSDGVTRQLRALETGSNYPAVNESDVRRVVVYSPDSGQRKAIAAVLDAVDKAIERAEAIIAKLRQIRTGLLHDLLTRGLDDNGELRDPHAHPEQFQKSPIGQIPKAWRYSKFADVLQRIDAGKSPDYPDSPASPGDWGVLKVSAIWPDDFRPNENKRVTKAIDQVEAYTVSDGDLLISRSNTYALVGLVCVVSHAPKRLMLCDKTLRLRLRPDRGINPYFAMLLRTQWARKHIEVNATGTSGSMKNISQGVIESIPLAYPDVDEQRRAMFAAAKVDDELASEREGAAKLRMIKAGLASDLLNGRLPVPETILQVTSP